MASNKEVLELAVRAGKILLVNGAEITRVQETIGRILTAFGIREYNVYVLSNGIFATVDELGECPSHAVRYVPLGKVHLGRIAAVNELSREIAEKKGEIDLAELRGRLDRCATLPEIPRWLRVLACGASAGCFCYILGGGWSDSLAALINGLLLQCFLLFCARGKMNKFLEIVFGSAWLTLWAQILLRAGLGASLDKVIIGSIIPLVPGIVLTTAIRDYFSENYISGVIYLIDALLTAACIAVGVATMLGVWNWLQGVAG